MLGRREIEGRGDQCDRPLFSSSVASPNFLLCGECDLREGWESGRGRPWEEATSTVQTPSSLFFSPKQVQLTALVFLVL